MALFSKTVAKINTASRNSIIILIDVYHSFISPFLGNHCRFSPTCSEYAKLAIKRHGLIRGLWLFGRRLLKCHPWCKQYGYDPVPNIVEKII